MRSATGTTSEPGETNLLDALQWGILSADDRSSPSRSDRTASGVEAEDYTIRPYESADLAAYLSLYADVLGGEMNEEWFDWKYESNPYVDHVPIFVAEADDEVVGARSFFALPLGDGDAEYDTLQPCDTMVHPDHQRRGLFTRMTEAAIERYTSQVDCFFNFPNQLSLRGNLSLGWRIVAERATHYRVQNPTAWATGADALEPVGKLLAGSYLSFRDRLAESATDFDLRWYDRVPAELLSSLAASGRPDRFHVVRDETFYEWRFGNPFWTYETVVAADEDEPVAALVLARGERDGAPTVRLADVVPLIGGGRRRRALSAILPEVVRRHADAGAILASADAIPEPLLSAHGFHSDCRPPLSWVATPTVHVARPVGDLEDGWLLGGRSLEDPKNWRLALCEPDSA